MQDMRLRCPGSTATGISRSTITKNTKLQVVKTTYKKDSKRCSKLCIHGGHNTVLLSLSNHIEHILCFERLFTVLR